MASLLLSACGGGGSAPVEPVASRSSIQGSAAIGPGAECPFGGAQVQSGIDVNANGVLDPAEVTSTQYVCSGAPGANGVASLVDVADEPAGVHCAAGGLRVANGLDANADGILQPTEFQHVAYTCSGLSGSGGRTLPPSLIHATPLAAGTACALGGFRLESGLDDNGNMTLDASEVDATELLCNGAASATAIQTRIRALSEPAGVHCPAGGLAIQTGLDDNADGTLQAAEVDRTDYVCNGAGAAPQGALAPTPLLTSRGYGHVTGALASGDVRAPDGSYADLFQLAVAQDAVLDATAIPAGAVELHVFTTGCLGGADLSSWGACFVGRADPRLRLPAGSYILMVKGADRAYPWSGTAYEVFLRLSGRPGLAPATVAEHVASGLSLFQSALATHGTDDFLGAVEHMSAAAARIGNDPTATAADLDRARFFGALAEVAVLAQPYSDGAPGGGLRDLGDLLDAYGLGGTTFQRSKLDTIQLMDCVETFDRFGYATGRRCSFRTLPASSPRVQELQAFGRTQLVPRLRAAASLLTSVGASFAAQIRAPGRSRPVELDLTDALALRALVQGLLAETLLEQSYDLDADLSELQANLAVKDAKGKAAYDQWDFLREHAFFLRLTSTADLPEARASALAAVRSARAALVALRAEIDDQSDDLLVISEDQCTSSGPPNYYYQCTSVTNPAARLNLIDANLADAEAALASDGAHVLTMGTADLSDDVTVDAGRFFAGLDLRDLLPPASGAGTGGAYPSLFPDPTFGGVLVTAPRGFDVNSDEDGDGSPDWLAGGHTWFYPGYLESMTFTDWSNTYQSLASPWTWFGGTFAFGASGTRRFSAVVDSQDPSGLIQRESFPGGYTYAGNVLTLTFDGAGVHGLKTVVVTANGLLDEWSPWVTLEFRDGSGTTLSMGERSLGRGWASPWPVYGPGVVYVRGSAIGDATWSKDKVWVVSGQNHVAVNGGTLTVQPGTVVKFESGGRLVVGSQSRLEAAGTTAEPVTFTALADDTGGDTDGVVATPAPGQWSGIQVNGYARFLDCRVLYGGSVSFSTAVYSGVQAGGLVASSLFARNAGTALTIAPGSAVTVTGTRFWGNWRPLGMPLDMSLDASNTFQDLPGTTSNQQNGVFVSTNGNIPTSWSASWIETEVPFVLDQSYSAVAIAGTLQLGASVTLKFQTGSGLHLTGPGSITFTPSTTFTAFTDDSVKGDTNGDGPSAGSAGYWYGVTNASNLPYTGPGFLYSQVSTP